LTPSSIVPEFVLKAHADVKDGRNEETEIDMLIEDVVVEVHDPCHIMPRTKGHG